jgi:integrase/recombinase XerD
MRSTIRLSSTRSPTTVLIETNSRRWPSWRVPGEGNRRETICITNFGRSSIQAFAEPYLLEDEVRALLDAPDPSTREGIRDRAMLHLAICGGLRVSELTGLQTADVVLPSLSIRVHGKGRRERALPLWETTPNALRAWMVVRGTAAVPELLVNARGEAMSRWGFAYVLKCHTETARRTRPSLSKKQASPHVLRYTCAMIVLRSTQDIRKVSLWLGHSDLATTEIYTRADPTEKLEALNAIVPPHLRRGSFRPSDKVNAMLRAKV